MRQQHPRRSRSVAWRRWALLAAVLLSGWGGTGAETASPEPPPGDEAGLQALAQGLPQIAAYKLRAFLRAGPAPARRREAVLALTRALLAVPDAPAALTELDAAYPLPPMPADLADPALAFWRGQALAALGRWPEALAHYTRAGNAPGVDPALAAGARFGQGEAWLALSANGDTRAQAEAAAVFKALRSDGRFGAAARLRSAEIALDSHHLKEAVSALLDPLPGGRAESTPGHPQAKEYAYLVGRLRLAQRQPALARQIFAGALDPLHGLSDRLLVDLYWGEARAFLDEDQPDRAQLALESLLDNQDYRFPRQPYLADIFGWLETLYGRRPNPDLSDLRRWSEDDTDRARAPLARLTLAHLEARAGRTENAESLLAGFGADFPESRWCPRALLDLAALRLNLGRAREARATLARARQAADEDARWSTGLETLAAQIDLAENEPARAAGRFETLADRLGAGAGAEAAAFNAALATLRSGDAKRFAKARGEFDRRFPRSPLAAEFALEEALTRAEAAITADPVSLARATDGLRGFLRDHPDHPRTVEARIALAELAFLQPTPDLPAARRELATMPWRQVSNEGESSVPPADHERADYLAIWLADAPGPAHDPEGAITLAKGFLEAHPDSPLTAEVRLKLGEIYFTREDYVAAQDPLETLIEKSPNSPLADAALYLAGRAATSSRSAAGLNKAVDDFSAAAKRAGPFRLPARLRLAELMLDKPENKGARDALLLYDDVLAATAVPAFPSEAELDARCAALSGRGQALRVLAAHDPALYPKAAAAFEQLATGTPGASLRWRRQAFTLKGQIAEDTGDTEGALAAYDDALNATADPVAGSGGEVFAPEWTWFYRAGRNAASLLEKQQQWAAAIAIYKKLATADGPMKSEFETLLARQRLEHFLWED